MIKKSKGQNLIFLRNSVSSIEEVYLCVLKEGGPKVRKIISLAISVILLFSGIPASFAGQTVIYKDGDIKPAAVSFESKDSLDGVKVYSEASGSSIYTAASDSVASVTLTDDRTEGNYAAKVTVGSSTNSNKNFIINLLDIGSAGITTSNFSKITLSVKPAMGAKSITFYANYISSGGTWAVSPSAVSISYTVGVSLESGKWNTVSLDLSALGLGQSFNTIQAVVNEESTWEFDDVQLKRQQAGTLTLSGTQDVASGGSLNTTESARLLYYTSGASDLSKGRIAGLNINAGRSEASTTDSSVQLLSNIGDINAKKVTSSIDGNTIYYVNNDGSKDVVYQYDRSAGTSTALTDFTDALKTYWSISDEMKTSIAPYNKTVNGISVSPEGNTVAIFKKGVRMPADTSSSAIVKADVIVFNDGKSFYRSGVQSNFASTSSAEVKNQNYWGIDGFSFISNSQLVGKEKYYALSGGTYQVTGAVRYKSFTLAGDTCNATTIDETTYLNLLSRQSLSSYDQYFVYMVEADSDTNNYVVNKYGDDRTIGGIGGNKVTVSYTDTTGTYTSSTAVTLKSQIVGMSPVNTDNNFVIVKTKPNTTTTATESSTGNTTSTGGSITNSTSSSSGTTTASATSTTTATGSSIGKTTTDANGNVTDISNIQNLIINGGFENGLSYWGNSSSSYHTQSTSYKKSGSYSLKTLNPPQGNCVYQDVTVVPSHKIYMASNIKVVSIGSDTGFSLIAIINSEGTGLEWGLLAASASVTDWTFGSDIYTIPASSKAMRLHAGYYTGTTSLEMYTDNNVMVDLTESFGAGNEPSKAWCDAHLTYGAIKNYDDASEKFRDNWYFKGMPCSISANGTSLKIANSDGKTADAYMVDANTIGVPNWSFTNESGRYLELRGTLSSDGNYIYWNNNTTWSRSSGTNTINTVNDTQSSSNTSSTTTQSDQQKSNSNTASYNSMTQSGSENEWQSTEIASSTTSTSTVTKYDWYAIDINKGTAVPLDFDYDNGIITAVNQVGTVMEITYVANNTTYTYRYDTLTKKLYNDSDGLETMKFNLYLSTKQPDGRYTDKKIVSLKSNITDIKTNRTAEVVFVKIQDNSWYMVNAKTGSATELKLHMNNPQVLYITEDNKIFLYDVNSRYAIYDPAADSLKEIRPADAANDKYLVVDSGRQILYRTTSGTLKVKYLEEVKADSGQYYLFSFDGKNTWQTYKNGKWQTACNADALSKEVMQLYGMSMSQVNALDASDFASLYDGGRQIYSIDAVAMLVAGTYYGTQSVESMHWFLDQDSNDNPLYGKKTYFAKAADLTAENARILDKIMIHETGPSDFTGYYFFEQDGTYFYYDENGWQDEDSDDISDMLEAVEGRYIDITQEGMTKQEVMAIPASELTEKFINEATSSGAVSFRLIYCSRIDNEEIDKYVSTPELAVEYNVFPTKPYKVIIRQTDGDRIEYTNLTKDQAEDFMAWIQQRQAGYGNVFYHMVTGTVDEFINYYMIVNVHAEREE